MTEYDDDGLAIPGSYAISTVHILGYGDGGKPMPITESAVCDTCNGWASNAWVTGRTIRLDPHEISDVRIKRREVIVVYACPEHSGDISDALVNEFGFASNTYDTDELAQRVSAHKF